MIVPKGTDFVLVRGTDKQLRLLPGQNVFMFATCLATLPGLQAAIVSASAYNIDSPLWKLVIRGTQFHVITKLDVMFDEGCLRLVERGSVAEKSA